MIVDAETLELRPLDLAIWARTWSPDGTFILAETDNAGLAMVDVTADPISLADVVYLENSRDATDIGWQPIMP